MLFPVITHPEDFIPAQQDRYFATVKSDTDLAELAQIDYMQVGSIGFEGDARKIFSALHPGYGKNAKKSKFPIFSMFAADFLPYEGACQVWDLYIVSHSPMNGFRGSESERYAVNHDLGSLLWTAEGFRLRAGDSEVPVLTEFSSRYLAMHRLEDRDKRMTVQKVGYLNLEGLAVPKRGIIFHTGVPVKEIKRASERDGGAQGTRLSDYFYKVM